MKILILNPNTSGVVTKKIENVIKGIARPRVEVVVNQIQHGPEALESYYDEARAAPYIIESVQKANESGFQAILLAAFCDPAIEALKEISDIPLIGIEEASFSVALLLGNKFGILTEKKHKEAVKTQHVRKLGLESRFSSVRALDMGVVEIAQNPERVKEKGKDIIRKMIREDGAEVVILGCASMAGLNQELENELRIPILDPIAVSYKMMEGLVELGLHHSKIGLFAKPAPKKWN